MRADHDRTELARAVFRCFNRASLLWNFSTKLLRYRERVLRRELEFRTSVHRDNRSLGTLIALLRFRPARQHVRCVMLYEVLISTTVAMVPLPFFYVAAELVLLVGLVATA